jgi:predicted methyltransferase
VRLQRATTILHYLDNQGRLYRQTDVCETYARGLCVGMKVIDRRRCAG